MVWFTLLLVPYSLFGEEALSICTNITKHISILFVIISISALKWWETTTKNTLCRFVENSVSLQNYTHKIVTICARKLFSMLGTVKQSSSTICNMNWSHFEMFTLFVWLNIKYKIYMMRKLRAVALIVIDFLWYSVGVINAKPKRSRHNALIASCAWNRERKKETEKDRKRATEREENHSANIFCAHSFFFF